MLKFINKNLLYVFLLNIFYYSCYCKNNFTLMLDPAGDASHSGRIISDNFERGITLQFAQALKKELENQNNTKNLRIILTRVPGETIEPLQNASFANRLQVDLYINLNFYQIREFNSNLSNIYIYYYLQHPITDFWFKAEPKKLEFLEFDQAYKLALDKSAHAAKIATENLKNSKILNNSSVSCYGLPFKPLIGIIAPAFGIEIGIKDKNNFKDYIKPVAKSLSSAIENLTAKLTDNC